MTGSPESTGTNEIRTTLTENVGMSDAEADVYLVLVKYGKQTMTDVAQRSEASKQRVYNVVDDLREKGFVEVTDDYPREAYAIDPSVTLEPLVTRLRDVEGTLSSLYQQVPTDNSGVSLFTTRESMERHVRDVIRGADRSVFAMLPVDEVETFREALANTTSVKMQLVVSDLDSDLSVGESLDLPEAVDYVRGVETNESIVVTGDRTEAFFWSEGAEISIETQEQGFRITNAELAFQLDRFLDVAIWSIATPTEYGKQDPTFPAEYVRIRNCLTDLKRVTESRPVDSFEIEFDGYDVETGERVTKRGVLTGYYHLPFDVRAYLEINVPGEADVVTVGGWKSKREDYRCRRITVHERDVRQPAEHIDEETAEHLATCREQLPSEPGTWEITLGFDGFIDRVREMADTRRGPDEYDRLDELQELGDRISKSASSNTSFTNEWVQSGTRCGGHTAHLARAFDRLDSDVTLIGTFGDPIRPEFREEFDETRLLSYGEPTVTDAVEFRDGKLLLEDIGDQSTVDWETVVDAVGLETLATAIDGADLLGIGYWTNIPLMPTIWDGLRTELWELLEDPPSAVFIDPADIRMLSSARLEAGIESLDRLDDTVPVTVSANRGETLVLANLSGSTDHGRSLSNGAELARETLGVSRFAAHSPVDSVLVDDEDTYRVAVPRSRDPALTTSSGDHFNAGLMLAQLNDLPGGAQLVVANAAAGEFVRTAEPPTYDQLRSFIDNYEDKFE